MRIALALFACLVASAGLARAADRPNILFLYGDDWAWPHASCLGTPVIKTPTFDRIAREGVLFRNAHVNAPSCSPSRSSVLTGQWFWRLEQGANLWSTLPAKFEVYPDLLEKAGYFVGLQGKGYGPGANGDRPRNAAGPNFKSFEAFLAARPKDKPFCFWFGDHFPHRPYPIDSGIKSGMDPTKVFVPPYLPDCEAVRRDICDYYYASQQFDTHAGEALAALEKTGELDNTIVVMSGDNGWPFPRSKANCYDTGTHQPLAIRWGAKVKGGRSVDDLVSLIDLAPTFVEAAGLTPPKAMTARSLMPILLSDKSGQVDPTRDHVLTGMERHATARKTNAGPVGYPMRTLLTHEFHYIRNFRPERMPAGDAPGFGDIDGGPSKAWLLAHRDEPAVKPLADRAVEKRPARELYDLRKDPYEMKNVAEDPAYADVAKRMDGQLAGELKATGDPRAEGKGDEFDAYPYIGAGAGAKGKKK